MSARSVRSGTISFGVVSIPFKGYVAQSRKASDFRRLHSRCGKPMMNGHFCTHCTELVGRENTLRGFEYARDQYAKFTDEELRELESARSGGLELLEFVPAESITVFHVRRTEILGPGNGGDRAYRLLLDVLLRTGLIGIGRFESRGRDQLVALRPYGRHLLLHELFYADEIRSLDEVESGGAFEFKDIELALADKLVEQLRSETFDLERYRDTWADRIKDGVLRKLDGEDVAAAPEAPKAQVIDMLEALKRQVAAAQQRVRRSNP